jgi:hypothetical protein
MTSFFEINGQRVHEVYDKNLGFSRLYTDDTDQLLVLIAPNFGAGWSTWNGDDENSKKLLMDSRIIRFYHDTYLKNKPHEVGLHIYRLTWTPFQEFLESLNIHNVYISTLSLEIHKIPKGTRFQVHEYDGSEKIVYLQEEKWTIA